MEIVSAARDVAGIEFACDHKTGAGVLTIHSPGGREQAELAANRLAFSRNQDQRLHIGVSETGGYLVLGQKEGLPVFTLEETTDRGAELAIVDSSGTGKQLDSTGLHPVKFSLK